MDYYYYNLIVYGETIRKKSRAQTAWGLASVATAGITLSVFFITSEFQGIFLVLEILLILFGVYSIIFYPLIFPSRLKKTASREYRKNALKDKTFSLRFSDMGIEEKITSGDRMRKLFRWVDFRIIYVYDHYIVFVRREQRGIMIPSRALKVRYDAELKSYVIFKANENDVKVVYQK
jgi:hypothetical protein